jgi:hypothetical protein
MTAAIQCECEFFIHLVSFCKDETLPLSKISLNSFDFLLNSCGLGMAHVHSGDYA